jgi:hypothetical protein
VLDAVRMRRDVMTSAGREGCRDGEEGEKLGDGW